MAMKVFLIFCALILYKALMKTLSKKGLTALALLLMATSVSSCRHTTIDDRVQIGMVTGAIIGGGIGAATGAVPAGVAIGAVAGGTIGGMVKGPN